MHLEIRTKDGVAIADLKGETAIEFYKYFSNDKVNFKKTVKTLRTETKKSREYDVFVAISDMKLNFVDEVKIWLLEGSYVKIIL